MGSTKLAASAAAATSDVPGGECGGELQAGEFQLPCEHVMCAAAAADGSS